MNWAENIQLFLLLKLMGLGIENLSTKGDHKNLREYAKIIQLRKPMLVRDAPDSLNQTPKVENKNI